MSVKAVLHSEWMKIRTLRSLLVALLGGLVATTGISAMVSATEDGSKQGDFDPVFSSFFGLAFGQIAAVSFGVLAVANEYAGGGIRVWLAAVPRRGLYYGCKLTVVGLCALAVGLVTGFASLLAGQALLGDEGVGLDAPGALRAAVGCGIYLALLTVLASGVAAVLRSSVGSLALVVPIVTFLSPVFGATSATRFLPDQAGQQVLHTAPEGPLGAWTGLGVLALYTAAAVFCGRLAVERRDS
ncbi:ABC transporter permease subunit [Streptomyces sp. NBS 14/10]|uniref:ABC transporter permease subunit n=1 Tax=Streptomyces sp. NBS 14/10 TaxID=1945643 RepID=UPI000B7E7C6E|nr:ABC transporter permease subunit [Streptomyces sp. NBS 14/10]KAK1177722.1 ABC transporter permease subunit [Streptomyces sp. NBS 14/10]